STALSWWFHDRSISLDALKWITIQLYLRSRLVLTYAPFRHRHPVHRHQNRVHGRFHRVGADAAAAEGLVAVFDGQVDFPQGVVAKRGGADLVIDALELDAGDFLRCQKGAVDGAVPVGKLFGELLVPAAECQLHARLVAGATGDFEGDERPFLALGA